MKLNQLEIKTFTNVVNYKLRYVKLTEAWWSDKNRFDFPLERTKRNIWNLSIYTRRWQQEKPDYPGLLSAESRAGGRELKWTPASPMSVSDEAGS